MYDKTSEEKVILAPVVAYDNILFFAKFIS